MKHLRWISEIVADGSEIKSRAGRSAKLGDGTSRNTKDCNELLEQRTKDLQGLSGQAKDLQGLSGHDAVLRHRPRHV